MTKIIRSLAVGLALISFVAITAAADAAHKPYVMIMGDDADGDRKITAGELHAYVRDKVQQQAARMGREQTPELQGDSSRVLVSW